MLAVRRSPNLSFTQACVTFVTGRLLKTTHQHPSDCTADVGSMTAVMADRAPSLIFTCIALFGRINLLQQNMTFFFPKLPSRSCWRRFLIGRYWPIPDLLSYQYLHICCPICANIESFMVYKTWCQTRCLEWFIIIILPVKVCLCTDVILPPLHIIWGIIAKKTKTFCIYTVQRTLAKCINIRVFISPISVTASAPKTGTASYFRLLTILPWQSERIPTWLKSYRSWIGDNDWCDC